MEDGPVVFLQLAPASLHASNAAPAPDPCAAGMPLPGQLWSRAGSAGEAWWGSSAGWEAEAGRGAWAEAAGVAAVASVVTVKVPAAVKCLVEACPAPGSAAGCPKPGPHGSTST